MCRKAQTQNKIVQKGCVVYINMDFNLELKAQMLG